MAHLNSGKTSPNAWKGSPEKAVAFIRSLYPTKTAESVAADTGVSFETVKKWLDGSSRPAWDGLWPLICAYGTPFILACVARPPEWAVRADRAQELADLRAEQARITKKLEALGA